MLFSEIFHSEASLPYIAHGKTVATQHRDAMLRSVENFVWLELITVNALYTESCRPERLERIRFVDAFPYSTRGRLLAEKLGSAAKHGAPVTSPTPLQGPAVDTIVIAKDIGLKNGHVRHARAAAKAPEIKLMQRPGPIKPSATIMYRNP